MSTTFASLGIEVNSSSASKAADDLDKLVDSAADAEKAIDDLGKSGEGLANTGKKISQAENEAAQGIDKATGAKERQVDASRKAGASAAGEIAIISQLDKAMSGNIGSMEQLIQAEGLLERSRKGGLVTIEQQEAYQDRLAKAYDKIEKAEAKEMAQKQRLIDAENRQIEALKRTVNGIDPVTAKLAKLEAQEKALNDLYKAGQIDATRYGEALAKIGKDRDSLTAAETAFDKLKLGTRQAQENLMQLTNALQSGDWGSGARAVAQLGAGAGASAASFFALAAPIALVTAAIGGLAYAFYKGSEEQSAYSEGLILTGNAAGTSANQLTEMARQVSSVVGTTGAAADVLANLAGNGKLASGSFVEIAEAALSMEKATGKSIDTTVAEFVKIADDPVEAAKSLNDQYHFLTASVYSQIVALKEQGDEVGAVKLLTDTYAEAVRSRAGEITQNLGLIEKGWKGIKSAAAEALDATLDVGRTQSFDAQIANYQKILDERKSGFLAKLFPDDLGSGSSSTKFIEEQISALKRQKAEVEANSKAEGDRRKAEDDAIEAGKSLHSSYLAGLDKEQKKKLEIAELDRNRAKALGGNNVDADRINREYAVSLQAINDKFKEPKKTASAADLSAFNDSKNALAGILTEYKNAQKELDAAQKAGLISQSDYLLKREAMIGNERDEVTAAYEVEIVALEAAKSKAGTSAAQRIQLDQKIADARAAMVKVQQDADTELSVLAKNEEGRLKKQALAVNTYTSALQQQVATLREQGQRAAAGIGLGDRQRDLMNQQNGIDDRFNQQKLELANQYGDGSRGMSLDEYTQKLAALKATQQDLHDTVQANYDEMTAAQGDWSAGASSAWQNYLDSAQNAAGQTKSLLTNAFSSAEDAVASFAINGKFSFSDFTKSVLADMAKIATRQATSQGLSALFGIAASAAGSYFGGGGGNGLAAGSAGAVSSDLGASQAGYTGIDFSGYRAAGGPVAPNSLYEVNELGPELYNEGGRSFLMTGANGGSVTPLTTGGGPALAAMSGGGGNTYNFPVAVSVQTSGSDGAGVSQETSNQLGKSIQQAAKTEAETAIARALQPGGSIWRLTNGRG
ncbi:phage tail tape measure protein [Pseudomonas sp. NMS19W]|uniref:phage tail tape measure protein n=1 Tax=Pseudomonas sp. NMS19W TaxID=3079768 RepID=UPI003F65EF5D